MNISEILMHLGEDREDYFHAVSPPVIQSSNFVLPDLDAFRKAFADEFQYPLYTRGNNPTVAILRQKLAALEGTEDALVFSSGSAAIAAAVIANVQSGDHIVCQQSPYSWTNALLRNFLTRFGVSHTFVDGTRIEHIEAALQPNTRLLYLESPNSLRFECQDLEACATLAQSRGILTLIDNSYCSPLYQNPASLGIDLVIHSGSKYLNGHSDVVMGCVCGSEAQIRKIFYSEYMTLGAIISPHDAALVLRGLRTLPIRIQRSQESAMAIMDKLDGHPAVKRIYYPFHPEFPQYELAKRQMRGCGGLFSIEFDTDSMEKMEDFVHRVNRFSMAVSWGGHESLMLPTIGFYKIPGKNTPALPWTFCRFYIGLEDPQWLWEGLEPALEAL